MSEERTWEEPGDLIIEQIEIGPMQNFTYIIGCKATREVVIVDPAWDVKSLVEHVEDRTIQSKRRSLPIIIPITWVDLSVEILCLAYPI